MRAAHRRPIVAVRASLRICLITCRHRTRSRTRGRSARDRADADPLHTAREPHTTSAGHLSAVHMPLKAHHLLVLIAETDIIGPVALALYCIGAVTMLIRRRMLWVLGAQVVLLLIMADVLYLHYLHHLWNAIYPWGDTDRILGVQYFLIPVVLAFGLFALWDLMRVLSRTTSTARWVGRRGNPSQCPGVRSAPSTRTSVDDVLGAQLGGDVSVGRVQSVGEPSPMGHPGGDRRTGGCCCSRGRGTAL